MSFKTNLFPRIVHPKYEEARYKAVGYTRRTIKAMNSMQITEAEKKVVFEDNACKLFRLPI